MLENVPGLQFLKCVSDTGHESDCDDDACTKVESPIYKISDTRICISKPVTTVILFQVPVGLAVPAEQLQVATLAPLELQARWQFISRAALPPRAPSLVS